MVKLKHLEVQLTPSKNTTGERKSPTTHNQEKSTYPPTTERKTPTHPQLRENHLPTHNWSKSTYLPTSERKHLPTHNWEKSTYLPTTERTTTDENKSTHPHIIDEKKEPTHIQQMREKRKDLNGVRDQWENRGMISKTVRDELKKRWMISDN